MTLSEPLSTVISAAVKRVECEGETWFQAEVGPTVKAYGRSPHMATGLALAKLADLFKRGLITFDEFDNNIAGAGST